MKRFFALLYFMVMGGLFTYAATISIKGRVVDSLTMQPLQYATVHVMDSTNRVIFSGVVNDSLGIFSFSGIPGEKAYKMLVSYVGYHRKDIKLTIAKKQRVVDVGVLRLELSDKQIGEVSIVGKQKVQNKVDRTVFLVDSTILSKAVAAKDVLSQISDIMVHPLTLNLNVKGRTKTLVLINGINNGQPVDIRRINPKDIEKVEVISSPMSNTDSDFDSVINIVLRSVPKKGLSGDFDLLVMPNGQYVDGNVGLMVGWEKVRLNTFYSYQRYDTPFKVVNIRKNQQNGDIYQTNGSNSSPLEKTHNLGVNVDFYLNPKNFINISTSQNLISVDKYLNNTGYSIKQGNTVALTPFTNRNASDYIAGNYTLFYRRTMKKEGRFFSANVNFHYMDGKEMSDFQYKDAAWQRNKESGQKYSANSKLEYSTPIGKFIKLTSGTQIYYQDFSGSLAGAPVENNFSNIRYNLYADLFVAAKKYEMRFGLKAEQYSVMYDNPLLASINKKSLFPTFILSRKLNKSNLLKMEYRSTSYYPSAWMLAPYRFSIDEKTAFVGNPKLKISIKDAVEFTHSMRVKGISFSSMAYFHFTRQMIASEKSYDAQNFLTISYSNSIQRAQAGLRFNGSFIFLGFIDFEPDLKVFHERYSFAGVTRKNISYTSTMSLGIMLPYGLGVGGFGTFNGKILAPQGYAMPNFSIDAVFIRKMFQKQNLDLFIGVRNLAYSREATYTFDVNTVEYSWFRRDAFGLAFRVTYLFNTGKSYKMQSVKKNFEFDRK